MKLKGLINEIDFRSQAAFDAYKEKHKMRDSTKVNVAGKDTTAGEASKKSKKKPTVNKPDSTKKDKGGASSNADKARKAVNLPGKERTTDLPHTRTNMPAGMNAKGGPGSGRKPKETPLKHTPTKEDSLEVKTISNFTTLRAKALSDFINKHKLDATAIANFVKKGSLKDRMMIGVALVGNPGNEYEQKVIDKFAEKEEKGNRGGFQTPKRQGNPNVNKHAKSSAEKAGLTPQKLGNDVYKKKMLQAAVEALTDSNYHSEARELIAKIEGKPEWAKKVEYPSPSDPKFKEKMADIRTNGVDSSEYWNHDDDTRNYAIGVSQESGWDGADAADGIAFTLRMNGFHKEADAIQSIFDDKPYMKAKK